MLHFYVIHIQPYSRSAAYVCMNDNYKLYIHKSYINVTPCGCLPLPGLNDDNSNIFLFINFSFYSLVMISNKL